MEKTKNICLIISLAGILILLLMINFNEIKTSKISSIKLSQENEHIKIMGRVISKQIYESNFTTFKLKDSSSEINVVCNCPNIKLNQTIELTGRIQQYKKQVQISADEIRAIKSKVKLTNK